MTILQEIYKWSKGQPAWQQDAIARLYEKRTLAVEDVEAIYAHLKAAHGIPDPEGRAARSLGDDQIAAPAVAERLVQLVAIKNLVGVNALAEGQRLPLAASGLSIIYGENGAGKSGYSRVLKKACRARDQREPILPDASKAARPGHASAQFELLVDGALTEVQWSEAGQSPEQLSELAIFDSTCARAYLDNQGDFAYAPYGLDLLEGLASLCSNVLRPRTLAEIANAKPNVDALTSLGQSSTKAGTIVKTLSAATKPEDVEALAELSEAEVERLATLSSSLAEANPKQKAVDIRLRAGAFARVCAKIDSAYEQLDPERLDTLRSLVARSNTAKIAAANAAGEFEALPGMLPGTGSEPWKELFNAARAFAIGSHALTHFPALTPNDQCPLCQNVLGADGSERIALFDRYMEAEAARIARAAREAAAEAYLTLKNSVLDLGLDDLLIVQLDSAIPELGKRCVELQSICLTRREAALKAAGDGSWDAIPFFADDVRTDLVGVIARLKSEAKALDDSVDEGARARLVSERDELEARRRLRELKTVVMEAIQGFRLSQKLQGCLAELSTLAISRKSTELSNTMATTEVVNALNAELKLLKVHELKAVMKPETSRGKTQYKLVLEHPAKYPPSSILSEGEQRAIALASFLAEITLGNGRGGVVFDDPVSSLDHRRRWEVARRLVREAKVRQVIVFTHDIYFLCILQQEADGEGVEPVSQCIHRTEKGFGVQSAMLPFDTLSTSKRVKALRDLHQGVLRHHKAGNEAIARDATRVAYSHLRMAWERAVEEVLLQGVVTRFKEGISTMPLPGVTVEDGDVKLIELGMSKCSKFAGHDPAASAHLPTPDPAELLQDIDQLESWRKSVVTRVEATKARRKAAG